MADTYKSYNEMAQKGREHLELGMFIMVLRIDCPSNTWWRY